MKTYRTLITSLSILSLFAVFGPLAKAESFSEKERVTFSQPVEIPDRVLAAGTYIFETDVMTHLTRILSEDQMHVYATLFTVPIERLDRGDKGLITLEESAKGAPERVQDLFFAGDTNGGSFIYPRHQAGN